MTREYGFGAGPASELQPFLDPGERLLWYGFPKKGLAFRNIDFFLIPFGLFFTIVISAMEIAAFIAGSMLFFILFFPFIFVGLYFLFGRWIYGTWQRSVTIYGVSDKRVLCRKPLIFKKQFYALPLEKINNIDISIRDEDVGTITFNSNLIQDFKNKDYEYILDNFMPPFYMITNVRYVYDIINGEKSKRTADHYTDSN
jgi:hypothetical protein